jgi:hypothetical protein
MRFSYSDFGGREKGDHGPVADGFWGREESDKPMAKLNVDFRPEAATYRESRVLAAQRKRIYFSLKAERSSTNIYWGKHSFVGGERDIGTLSVRFWRPEERTRTWIGIRMFWEDFEILNRMIDMRRRRSQRSATVFIWLWGKEAAQTCEDEEHFLVAERETHMSYRRSNFGGLKREDILKYWTQWLMWEEGARSAARPYPSDFEQKRQHKHIKSFGGRERNKQTCQVSQYFWKQAVSVMIYEKPGARNAVIFIDTERETDIHRSFSGSDGGFDGKRSQLKALSWVIKNGDIW